MCGDIKRGWEDGMAVAYCSTVVRAGTKQVCFLASVSQLRGTYMTQGVLDCAVLGRVFGLQV